ncbi:MAG: hypothetical protein IKY16_10770 [Bacteroidales bacterium]|nr:hypothetical protein [Bacteroidales bacterium]
MAGKIDSIINSAVATLIGIIMLCSVVIPIGVDQIATLTGDASAYAPLIGVAITMSVVAVIIGVVRYFSSSKE